MCWACHISVSQMADCPPSVHCWGHLTAPGHILVLQMCILCWSKVTPEMHKHQEAQTHYRQSYRSGVGTVEKPYGEGKAHSWTAARSAGGVVGGGSRGGRKENIAGRAPAGAETWGWGRCRARRRGPALPDGRGARAWVHRVRAERHLGQPCPWWDLAPSCGRSESPWQLGLGQLPLAGILESGDGGE